MGKRSVVSRTAMFTLAELEGVIPIVRASVPPTLQYAWPLLRAHTGVEVVVKHEKPHAISAFKVREARVRYDRGGPSHSSNVPTRSFANSFSPRLKGLKLPDGRD